MINVLGATGFIGSHFCEMFSGEVNPIEKCYLRCPEDNILYLISTTHNYNPLHKDVNTNLLHLSRVLQYLTPDHTFNFISSWFVYATETVLPAKEEDHHYIPLGNYSMTKWLAERLVATYCTKSSIPWRIFRLANVFGEGDNFSKKKNALQYLVNELKHDRPIELYYGGDFIRDYIYVGRLCFLLYSAMFSTPVNSVYNIGSGIPTKFGELIEMARIVLKSKSTIKSIDPPQFHKDVSRKDFWMDVSRLQSYVPFKFDTKADFLRMLVNET